MAALNGASPVLGVHDVVASAAFVRDRLGFQLLGTAGGDPPRFAILQRDGVELFLQFSCSPRSEGEGWSAYLKCDDAAAVHADLAARGAPITGEPVDQPYRQREFEVAGPEGHVIVFAQPLP